MLDPREEAGLDDGTVRGLDEEVRPEGLGQQCRRTVSSGLRWRQMRWRPERKSSPSRRRSSRRSFAGGPSSASASGSAPTGGWRAPRSYSRIVSSLIAVVSASCFCVIPRALRSSRRRRANASLSLPRRSPPAFDPTGARITASPCLCNRGPSGVTGDRSEAGGQSGTGDRRRCPPAPREDAPACRPLTRAAPPAARRRRPSVSARRSPESASSRSPRS
jgi:hypothetical protein